MTDRELLEAAAKAGGIDLELIDLNGRIDGYDVNGDAIVLKGWNAFEDDGDALRLAVKKGMLFTYSGEAFEAFQRFYREELDTDKRPSIATRRAIVRVAAAMATAVDRAA